MNYKFGFLLFILFFSCGKRDGENDESLCHSITTNSSDIIKISGAYYYQYNYNGANFYKVYFLYKTGCIIDLQVLDESEWNDLGSYLSANGYYSANSLKKLDVGIYTISDSNLVIEKWYPAENFLPVYKSLARIKSDTSFLILNSSKCDGSDYDTENELYQFISFHPKPDSTNLYIN